MHGGSFSFVILNVEKIDALAIMCLLQVADVSEMVRQRVDALMLSGESAMGQFPEKALSVLRTVSLRIEEWCREEKFHESSSLQQLATALPDQISEQICNAGALMG